LSKIREAGHGQKKDCNSKNRGPEGKKQRPSKGQIKIQHLPKWEGQLAMSGTWD